MRATTNPWPTDIKLITNRWAWELVYGDPGSGNHPQSQPLTGTVTLYESVETTYLTHTYLETSDQQGGKKRGENPQRFAKYTANDSQWSARNTAAAMQQDTIALQVFRGPPLKSRTVKWETAD